MKRPSWRAEHGLSFAEMMVTGAILTSFALMATLWLTGVSDLWWTATTQEQVRADAAMVMNRMLVELRRGTRSTSPVPPGVSIPGAFPNNTSITLFVPMDGPGDGNDLIIDDAGNTEWDTTQPLQFVHDAPSQELRSIDLNGTRVLARGVTTLRFDDLGTDATMLPNEVRVTLTLQMTTPRGRLLSASSTETVRLRN